MSSEALRRSSTSGSPASGANEAPSAVLPKTAPSAATTSRTADVCQISAGAFSSSCTEMPPGSVGSGRAAAGAAERAPAHGAPTCRRGCHRGLPGVRRLAGLHRGSRTSPIGRSRLPLVAGAARWGSSFTGRRHAELDEPPDQLGDAQAGELCLLRIHARGSESGEGVHLADEEGVPRDQEIDTSHADAVERTVRGERQLLKTLREGRLDLRARIDVGKTRDVLRLVVVPLVVAAHLTRLEDDRLMVAQDSAFQLAGTCHIALDDDLGVVAQRLVDCCRQLSVLVNECHAHAAAKAGRLHDAQLADRSVDVAKD